MDNPNNPKLKIKFHSVMDIPKILYAGLEQFAIGTLYKSSTTSCDDRLSGITKSELQVAVGEKMPRSIPV
ncbi:MAG UNVERIFIED_CONTAM: hypothetical protein LVQ98_06550 [Rickettsiaceae bacterium]